VSELEQNASNRLDLELFYDREKNYSGDLNALIHQCIELQHKHRVRFEQFEAKDLRRGQTEQILSDIRGIIPQERGSIVTSRGSMLPLSKSKKLNLGNTPVLLVKSRKKPVYVFPCRVGETYYDIPSGIKHLKENLPKLVPLSGEMEAALTERIKESPDILESGLTLLGEEVAVPSGKADLLFKDALDRRLIVEVEREATDDALGQILRLGAGYEEMTKLPRSMVRIGIACSRASKSISAAADRGDIKIWKI
jgi:endonuclease